MKLKFGWDWDWGVHIESIFSLDRGFRNRSDPCMTKSRVKLLYANESGITFLSIQNRLSAQPTDFGTDFGSMCEKLKGALSVCVKQKEATCPEFRINLQFFIRSLAPILICVSKAGWRLSVCQKAGWRLAERSTQNPFSNIWENFNSTDFGV